MFNKTNLEKAILKASSFKKEEKELLLTRSSVLCDLAEAQTKLSSFNYSLKVTQEKPKY